MGGGVEFLEQTSDSIIGNEQTCDSMEGWTFRSVVKVRLPGRHAVLAPATASEARQVMHCNLSSRGGKRFLHSLASLNHAIIISVIDTSRFSMQCLTLIANVLGVTHVFPGIALDQRFHMAR